MLRSKYFLFIVFHLQHCLCFKYLESFQGARKPIAFLRTSLGIIVIQGSLFSNNFVVNADSKLRNLSPDAISRIVSEDIEKRQALATADFTRDIYDESCTFQDEIDTYEINEYVKGTKALFNAAKSHVALSAPVIADDKAIEIPFKETLAFNLPFNPKMDVSGRVLLTRGSDGLVVRSREFWDKSVTDVIRSTHF